MPTALHRRHVRAAGTCGVRLQHDVGAAARARLHNRGTACRDAGLCRTPQTNHTGYDRLEAAQWREMVAKKTVTDWIGSRCRDSGAGKRDATRALSSLCTDFRRRASYHAGRPFRPLGKAASHNRLAVMLVARLSVRVAADTWRTAVPGWHAGSCVQLRSSTTRDRARRAVACCDERRPCTIDWHGWHVTSGPRVA